MILQACMKFLIILKKLKNIKHYNKQLYFTLINSNLDDLAYNKNTKIKRSFSYLNKENETKNIICPKKRIYRKRSNLELTYSKYNNTNTSSRYNTPIKNKINLNNFSNVNEGNIISKSKPNLISYKSNKALNIIKNKCPIKLKTLEPFKGFLKNYKKLNNLKENGKTLRGNNNIINTPIANKIFENHFIRNKNYNNTSPIKLNNILNTSINSNKKINKIGHINPKIKKICGLSKKKLKDKEECKGKNINNKIYFLYEDNEDFLLRFKLNKIKKHISIECLNTKEISTESEMFSNTYEICDILNISPIPKDLDLIEALKKLLDKYPPSGIFNEEQKEFNLKITYDNNIKNTFILVKNKCEDSKFIKKNIDKKNNQDKKK
jgi:hypothetical protein